MESVGWTFLFGIDYTFPLINIAMRTFVFLCMAATVGYAVAADASKLTLVCTGHTLVFDNWVLQNPGQSGSNVVVDIDKKAKTISFLLPHSGPIVAKLDENEQFYSGTKRLDAQLWGKPLLYVNFTINRLTGKGYASYAIQTDGSGYGAFDGVCAPGQAKF